MIYRCGVLKQQNMAIILINNMTKMQTCLDLEIESTNLCSSTLERCAQNCKNVVI